MARSSLLNWLKSGVASNRVQVHTTHKTNSKCFIERFNKAYSECILDAYFFDAFYEEREVTEVWVKD